jgi:hypothetical protein
VASTDLFAEQSYVIDASSLVDIHQQEDDDSRVWAGIFGLIRAGRLCTVSYALEEVEDIAKAGRFSMARFERLKEMRKHLIVSETEELTLEAGRIVYENPHIRDWRQKKNAADPWVIAAGILYNRRVITQERDTGPKVRKRIPWVCDQQKPKVKWIRLRRMIEDERFLEEGTK